jgi:aldehyde:ferredoxin oxidoreductase
MGIYDLTRAINIKMGVTRKDDYPPERVFNLPMTEGPHAGKILKREDYEAILDTYYSKRGWTKDGLVDQKKVETFNDPLITA